MLSLNFNALLYRSSRQQNGKNKASFLPLALQLPWQPLRLMRTSLFAPHADSCDGKHSTALCQVNIWRDRGRWKCERRRGTQSCGLSQGMLLKAGARRDLGDARKRGEKRGRKRRLEIACEVASNRKICCRYCTTPLAASPASLALFFAAKR